MFVKQVSVLAVILLLVPLRINVTPLVHVILLLELATTLRHLLPKPVTTEIRARKPILVNSVSVLAVILLLVPLRINVTFLELVIPPMEFAITPRHLMAKVVTTEMRARKPILAQQVSVLAVTLSVVLLWINVTFLELVILPLEFAITPRHLLAHLAAMAMDVPSQIPAPVAFAFLVLPRSVPLLISATFLAFANHPLVSAPTLPNVMVRSATMVMLARN
jgi:hypothetical protein